MMLIRQKYPLFAPNWALFAQFGANSQKYSQKYPRIGGIFLMRIIKK